MNLHNKLNFLTKLSVEKRTKALRWVAKQNEELILLTFEKQKKHFFNISHKKEEKPVLYLSAIYLAANELYDAHRSQNTKNRSKNIFDIANITEMQARQLGKKRSAPKTERLLNLKGKILTLLEEENFSYDRVSAFLKRFHDLDISHTWIRKIYLDIKDEK